MAVEDVTDRLAAYAAELEEAGVSGHWLVYEALAEIERLRQELDDVYFDMAGPAA